MALMSGDASSDHNSGHPANGSASFMKDAFSTGGLTAHCNRLPWPFALDCHWLIRPTTPGELLRSNAALASATKNGSFLWTHSDTSSNDTDASFVARGNSAWKKSPSKQVRFSAALAMRLAAAAKNDFILEPFSLSCWPSLALTCALADFTAALTFLSNALNDPTASVNISACSFNAALNSSKAFCFETWARIEGSKARGLACEPRATRSTFPSNFGLRAAEAAERGGSEGGPRPSGTRLASSNLDRGQKARDRTLRPSVTIEPRGSSVGRTAGTGYGMEGAWESGRGHACCDVRAPCRAPQGPRRHHAHVSIDRDGGDQRGRGGGRTGGMRMMTMVTMVVGMLLMMMLMMMGVVRMVRMMMRMMMMVVLMIMMVVVMMMLFPWARTEARGNAT
eukprot:9489346-Pyramimonas_sp.AAC.1